MANKCSEVGDESIDDSLYSRQRYVLGDAAMKKMAVSNVFLSGLGGTGIEIAKNVALAGIRTLTLHDTKAATALDLGAQFYITAQDVDEGRARLEVSARQLAELNPYVKINTSDLDLSTGDLSFLEQFKVVVLTDSPLPVMRRVNAFCHERDIGFIAADVRGVFCYTFVDLGNGFEVLDSTGEKPKSFLVSKIETSNPARVHCVENHRHDLQSGDAVSFAGLDATPFTCLEKDTFKVKVDTPFTFLVEGFDASGLAEECLGRGQATEVKVPVLHDFKALEISMKKPDLLFMDLAKFEAPSQQHLAFRALWAFEEEHSRLPEPWNDSEAQEVLQLALHINSEESHVEKVDDGMVLALAHTAQGQLAPLAAFMGGVVGQEVLKATSGKFSPIQQWLHVGAMDVLPEEKEARGSTAPDGKRTDSLKICIGEEGVEAVACSRLFMVGAGAIGCEMIKNYAMLGACIGEAGGKVVVTDNDLIERSNLNRQFLFRSKDINQPKSVTAAAAATAMNAGIAVDPRTDKMGPDTVGLYPDAFYAGQHMIVNALDNLQARLYMDARAVSNQLALIDSGTLGAKGHVQVVVPHKSESYGSQRDPETADIAYCTLKSFPSSMDHCIVWARDLLFEDYFRVKPSDFQLFQDTANLSDRLSERDPELLKSVLSVAAMVEHKPIGFSDCVAFGRAMFEEFFRNNALQLLDAFPLDHKASDIVIATGEAAAEADYGVITLGGSSFDGDYNQREDFDYVTTRPPIMESRDAGSTFIRGQSTNSANCLDTLFIAGSGTSGFSAGDLVVSPGYTVETRQFGTIFFGRPDEIGDAITITRQSVPLSQDAGHTFMEAQSSILADGGDLCLQAGSSGVAGVAGDIFLETGLSAPNPTGGNIFWGMANVDLTVRRVDATSGDASPTVISGHSTTLGAGGDLVMTAGDGVEGGDVNVTAADSTRIGGSVVLTGANGTNGSPVSFIAGDGTSAGGGYITIRAGASGFIGTPTHVTFAPGTGTAGSNGSVLFNSSGVLHLKAVDFNHVPAGAQTFTIANAGDTVTMDADTVGFFFTFAGNGLLTSRLTAAPAVHELPGELSTHDATAAIAELFAAGNGLRDLIVLHGLIL